MQGPTARPRRAEAWVVGTIVPLATPVGASLRRWWPSGRQHHAGSAVAANPVVMFLSGATSGAGPLVRVSGGNRFHSFAGGRAGAMAVDVDDVDVDGAAVWRWARISGLVPPTKGPQTHCQFPSLIRRLIAAICSTN